MVDQEILRTVARRLPPGLKSLAKRLYYRNSHWAHPALKGFGTVQDLYYWVADGNLDTLLVLQNYFSVIFPGLNAETQGTVTVFNQDGGLLGAKTFALPHHGAAKLRVSELLRGAGGPTDETFGETFGTLEVHIAIPTQVIEHIKDHKGYYFWDRFYVGYTNSLGQTCFVHGVDKTHIYRDGGEAAVDWYPAGRELQWAPEIPVNIEDYERFTVIMINRTSRSKEVTLTLMDSKDASLAWEANIPPKGVRRFPLTKDDTGGLEPTELRMRMKGMATQYGRPVVFKEFPNGAISAMHC